jgi:hypothetical protein
VDLHTRVQQEMVGERRGRLIRAVERTVRAWAEVEAFAEYEPVVNVVENVEPPFVMIDVAVAVGFGVDGAIEECARLVVTSTPATFPNGPPVPDALPTKPNASTLLARLLPHLDQKLRSALLHAGDCVDGATHEFGTIEGGFIHCDRDGCSAKVTITDEQAAAFIWGGVGR